MELSDTIGVTGRLSVELFDRGRLVERHEWSNAYTDMAALAHAVNLAADPDPPSLALSNIGLGVSGPRITSCESTAGWTGSPSLDTSTEYEAVGAIYKDVAQSGSADIYHATVVSSTDLSAGGAGITVALRLDYRARCVLANSQLRIYTGGSASNYYLITYAGIETVAGSQFADGTWKLVTIPTASFSSGGGSPSWGAVTGVGLHLEASGVGALRASIDDVRGSVTVDTSKTAATSPYEATNKAVTQLLRSGLVVTASALWGEAEAVGYWTVGALYCAGGTYLAAIAPIGFYKAKNLVLAANWTVTTRGG